MNDSEVNTPPNSCALNALSVQKINDKFNNDEKLSSAHAEPVSHTKEPGARTITTRANGKLHNLARHINQVDIDKKWNESTWYAKASKSEKLYLLREAGEYRKGMSKWCAKSLGRHIVELRQKRENERILNRRRAKLKFRIASGAEDQTGHTCDASDLDHDQMTRTRRDTAIDDWSEVNIKNPTSDGEDEKSERKIKEPAQMSLPIRSRRQQILDEDSETEDSLPTLCH